MLKPKTEDEFFDLLTQDFNDEEFNEDFVDKKKIRRVFVAS
jgi:hypothetical protein